MANENLDENMATKETTETQPEITLPEEMPKRVNPFCVISIETYGEYAAHDIQTNSAWTSNPYGETYAEVPDDLVPEILATCGYCDIELNEDGTEVVSFTAREIPETAAPEPEPTTDDILNALLGVE